MGNGIACKTYICIHRIYVDYVGSRAPTVGALSDAGAVVKEREQELRL